MKFLDEAKVFVKAGDGGDGCVSFRREKFIARGGPGGGRVVVECVDGLNTLIDFRYRQHFKGERGHHGMGKDRTGAYGKDAVMHVPVGTQILAEDKETVIADMTEKGQRVVLAEGGSGGHGNAHFKSSTNQAPRRASPGYIGEEQWLWLRLKLIADIGLVGLPNAGKSTFLAAVSRAKPKVANYPFTTIHPNLGVVVLDHESFVIADIPGLIEGASEGIGLGTRFLGHIERCRALLHLIDGTEEDVVSAYQTVRTELTKYGTQVAAKYEIVALNKCDALTPEEIEEKRAQLAAVVNTKIVVISGVAGIGVRDLINQLLGLVQQGRVEDQSESREDTQVFVT